MIWCDDEAANAINQSVAYKGRVKHVDVKCHFLRYKVREGLAQVEYINTHDNPADIFTKPIPRDTHVKHASVLLVRL